MILIGLLFLSGCALPRWPVPEARVTSSFGVRFRGLSPEVHRGIDLAVPEGTPVRAYRGGRVRFSGTMKGYGEVIVLEHRGRTASVYAHLSRRDVKAGQRVKHAQVIGQSGKTGNARGAHLHFEILRWGRAEDPEDILGRYPPPK